MTLRITGFALAGVLRLIGCVSQEVYDERVGHVQELEQALQAQSTELGSKLAESERRVGELEEALRQRESRLSVLHQELRTLQSRYQSALRRLHDLDEDRSEDRARIESLQVELKKLQEATTPSDEPGRQHRGPAPSAD